MCFRSWLSARLSLATRGTRSGYYHWPYWPRMPDWVKISLETCSTRFVARLKSQSACGRIYPIEIWWMKLGIGFIKTMVAINSSTMLCFVFLYRTLCITLHTVRADCDCVWWLCLPLYQLSIESNSSKSCPALAETRVPANADTLAEPFLHRSIYIKSFFGFRDFVRLMRWGFFCLGLSMRLAEVEFSDE